MAEHLILLPAGLSFTSVFEALAIAILIGCVAKALWVMRSGYLFALRSDGEPGAGDPRGGEGEQDERYCERAAAQLPGKVVEALTFDEAMRNWSLTFTDGTHVTFGSLVVERYLPDGQDARG